MLYQRIEEAEQLPPSGLQNARAREKADIDFKTWCDPNNIWENAKDVAAFANALGGVLIIGADDSKGQGPLAYPGLQRAQTFAQVQKIYDDAAKKCSPAAHVDAIPISLELVQLVAVNVSPFIDQALSSPVGSRDASGNPIKPGEGWVFPIRRGAQTDYLKPEVLPMYMNRDIRRTVLMLERIPTSSRRNVTVHARQLKMVGYVMHIEMATPRVMQFETVDLGLNRVRFTGPGFGQINMPILDVEDVWESRDGAWDVRVTGELKEKSGQAGLCFVYAPLHI